MTHEGTRWVGIWPEQEPFLLPVDAQSGRAQWAFNVATMKRPSPTVAEEIVAILEAAEIVVSSGAEKNVGTSAKSHIPQGDAAFVAVAVTGGLMPLRTHDRPRSQAYGRPGVQILVSAASSSVACAKAWECYAALADVSNRKVAPVPLT